MRSAPTSEAWCGPSRAPCALISAPAPANSSRRCTTQGSNRYRTAEESPQKPRVPPVVFQDDSEEVVEGICGDWCQNRVEELVGLRVSEAMGQVVARVEQVVAEKVQEAVWARDEEQMQRVRGVLAEECGVFEQVFKDVDERLGSCEQALVKRKQESCV